MQTITENFEEILRSKQIPLAKSLGEAEETFYTGNFQVTAEKVVPFSIAFQQSAERSDVQIHYSQLGYLKNTNQKAELFTVLNQLNESESGYYRVCLAVDGEIYLRLLTRTTKEVLPVYEMLVAGSSVASLVLEKVSAFI